MKNDGEGYTGGVERSDIAMMILIILVSLVFAAMSLAPLFVSDIDTHAASIILPE